VLSTYQVDALKKASTSPEIRLWYAVLFLALHDCKERITSRKAQTAVYFIWTLVTADDHVLKVILPQTKERKLFMLRQAISCYMGVGKIRMKYLVLKFSLHLYRNYDSVVHNVLGALCDIDITPTLEPDLRLSFVQARAVKHAHKVRSDEQVRIYYIDRTKLWKMIAKRIERRTDDERNS
jgi:hypothetical protein